MSSLTTTYRYNYRNNDHHHCSYDAPSTVWEQCENILCQIWNEQKTTPRLNKATYFSIQNDGPISQTSKRSKPYYYLPLESNIVIHHACHECIEEHPYKTYMLHFPDGMHAILHNTKSGLHRTYKSTPVTI